MKKIILIKHATTAWNRAGRVQGRTNIDLNEDDAAAALLLAEKLKPLAIQKIITSPLKRASRTAEIVAQALDIPVLVGDERIQGCSFGSFEGMTKDEAIKKYGEEILKVCGPGYSEYDFTEFGGESKKDVFARHLDLFKELSLYPEENILLVGHGRGLNTLLGGLGYPADLESGDYRIIEI